MRTALVGVTIAALVVMPRVGRACEVGDAEDCSARCAKHDVESCAIFGIMLATGRGVEKNPDKGRQLLESACAAKSARGCVDLASLSENALGVAKDEAAAFAAYEKSCEKGKFPYGCIRLAGAYEAGHGVTADVGKAAELYQRACDAGDLRGCTQLGRLTETGKGVAKDRAKAEQLYKSACDRVEPAGCAMLGALYDKSDQPKAMTLYQLACDHHYWLACTRLGYIYSSGPSFGPMDLVHGMPLYERACDHSELDACNNLGLLYAGGNGIAQDAAKAKALYQRACDGGNASGCKNLKIPIVATSGPRGAPAPPTGEVQDESACDKLEGVAAGGCYNTLGLAYAKGWTANKKQRAGLKQDLPRAAQLYKKACELGEPSGCINYGSQLYLGTAVAKDVPKGLKLLHRACFKDSHPDACDYLKKLPAWTQDKKLVKALPDWATDGPIDPVEGSDSKMTGPGCDKFWAEKHTDSPRVAKMQAGADLAIARLKEAKRPETVSVEIWNACMQLSVQYLKAHRAEIDRDARQAERETVDEPDETPQSSTRNTSNNSARDAAAKEKKKCMDQCFKDYSKCHQPRTGPSICQPAKQRCEKDC